MIINIIYGFLGAGKTTLIRRVLDNPPEDEKLVVLVNEFGDVGIDRRIMGIHENEAANIVEMASGCVCCTMASDFRRQIRELHERYAPDRMIIEPTGVAVISQLTRILEQEDIKELYSDIRRICIVDSSDFLPLMKSNRNFMENQIRAGHSVILNKTDRLKPRMADLLAYSIKEINPAANVYLTRFCDFEPVLLMEILGKETEQKPETDLTTSGELFLIQDYHGFGKFESFSRRYQSEIFDSPCLESFFRELSEQRYGEVARTKGIFRTIGGWLLMELASGEVRADMVSEGKESVIAIIGKMLNVPELENRLEDCRVTPRRPAIPLS